jgi:hypothetical protein
MRAIEEIPPGTVSVGVAQVATAAVLAGITKYVGPNVNGIVNWSNTASNKVIVSLKAAV